MSESDISLLICRNFNGIESNYVKQIFASEGFNIKPHSAKDLIIANLNDNSSRHLMILTVNSVAVDILFGFEDEASIKILIGSEFKGDKSELYIIQQINEIKNAMATGSKIILLNHDNIYEALYDVLNQRYIYNNGVKMLRLAIGSKSQMCPVMDGFKIIAIIEKEHAYNDLDLPLLNRFEKQILDLSDIDTSFLDPIDGSEICGFNSNTLPSLVLATKHDHIKILHRMLYPMAAIKLQIKMPSFDELIKWERPMIVFTKSPISHLSTGEKVIYLFDVATEKQFIELINQHERVIVQCDPINCTAALINHARHLCADKKVIFIIHLPNERKFDLIYRQNWDYYYVDDLQAGDILTLVNNTPHYLATAGIIDLRHIIQTNYQSALNLVTMPFVEHLEITKFKHYAALLKCEPFLQIVETLILKALETANHMAKIPNHGTFRQSILEAINTLIITIFASIIRSLDQNFNTRLYFADPASWCINYAKWPMSGNNLGKHGILIAKYPFSFNIIKTIEAQKEYILTMGVKIGDIYELSGNALDYLHDFVNITTYPHLPFDDTLAIYKMLISLHGELTIESIHMISWQNTDLLFLICTTLPQLAVPHFLTLCNTQCVNQALITAVTKYHEENNLIPDVNLNSALRQVENENPPIINEWMSLQVKKHTGIHEFATNTLEFFKSLNCSDLALARYVKHIAFGHLDNYMPTEWKSTPNDLVEYVIELVNGDSLTIAARNIMIQTLIKYGKLDMRSTNLKRLYINIGLSMRKFVDSPLNDVVERQLELIKYAGELYPTELSECEQMFVLKYIRCEEGIDGLARLLHMDLPWLTADRNLIKTTAIINPLPWVASDRQFYEKLIAFVNSANIAELENLKDIPYSWFIAAVASQITLAIDSVYSVDELQKWALKTFNNPYLSLIPKLMSNQNIVTNYDILKFQLQIHITCLSLTEVPGIFTTIIFNPEMIPNLYLPAIVDDEFVAVAAAAGRVGWYKCRNGHKYAVGHCTLPMEKRQCIVEGCSAEIGGHDHVSVAGTTKIEQIEDEGVTKPGYINSNDYNLYSAGRANRLATVIIRVMLHLCMNIDIDKDIKALMELTSLSLEDAFLSIHLVLRDVQSFNTPESDKFIEVSARNVWEQKIQESANKIFVNVREHLETAKLELQDGKMINLIKAAYGFDTWANIHEKSLVGNDILWQIRKPVTYAGFYQVFNLNSQNAIDYPVLDRFLKSEDKLRFIKYIADILAWHAVLFANVKQISRQDAQTTACKDIVKNEREYKILLSFITAFNETISLVPYLFECQKNPFIDLKITVDTTINFALPSNDAPGMCTIAILNFLAELTGNGTHIINYLTDPAIIKQYLIDYDRELNLMPALVAFCGQTLQYGEGVGFAFNMAEIQNVIINDIFKNKLSIRIAIQQFQYIGELQSTNKLQLLNSLVPQVGFPADKIWAEIDTHDKLNEIMTQIEECVNFITTIGKPLDGTIKLDKYIAETFLKDTFSLNIELRHIKALVTYFNEQINGKIQNQLPLKYRAKINDDLRNFIMSFDADELKIIYEYLYNLVSDYLVKENWNEMNDLKQYLLIDEPWFDKFPVEIQLAHVYELFMLLK